ncbi:MAG: hypothetical protein JW874_15990 [Spirochaetales bacterium]|nr:hypothetical protein [Spirochaetales bacterium]
MSKYDPVWEHIRKDGSPVLKLTFDDIKKITRFEIDHSFLNYKKEAKEYGYEVRKISLKEKTVVFNKAAMEQETP